MGKVSDFFDSVLGVTKQDSAAQLEQARRDSKRWTADQEREAKANGFASAQAMYEFSRQKQMRRTTNRNIDVNKAVSDASAWHPSVMLNNVLNAIQGATGEK